MKDSTTDMSAIANWARLWPDANWGVQPVGGFVVDVDIKKDDGEASLWMWQQAYGALPVTATVETGSGGRHYYFTSDTPVGNPTGWLPGVDIKSTGGYVVLPGSRHISGGTYQWVGDSPSPVVSGPPALVTAIQEGGSTQSERAVPSDGLSGFAEGHRNDGLFRQACRWRAQGLDRQQVGLLTLDLNTRCTPPLEAEEVAATVRSAFQQDHSGNAPRPSDEELMWAKDPTANRNRDVAALLDLVKQYALVAGTLSEQASGSSWEPADIASLLVGGVSEHPRPGLLRRSDGNCLLYDGLLNGLHGESESGKTWVALLACVQVLSNDEPVLYLDFESSHTDIAQRLLALGADPEHVAGRLTYISPSERYTDGEVDDLARLLVDGQFRLTVLDGVTDAMSAFGYGPRDESEYARFKRELLLPLSVAGSALVTIDHVARGSDGREALGTQHKRASIRGSALNVKVIKPFGRGRAGAARLTVSKDRPGWVRGDATRENSEEVAGIFRLSSCADGGLIAELLTVEQANANPQQSIDALAKQVADGLSVEVARFMEAVREQPGATGNDLKKALGVRSIAAVADEAERLGLLTRQSGPRNATLHHASAGMGA